MKFNWKTPLITGAFLASSIFYGYSQAQEKPSFVDSVMAEAEEYPTTTHFGYSNLENSNLNFHDINKLESIIKNVENQCGKKEKYSKWEVIKILNTTDNEIKNFGLKIRLDKFNCDDFSSIYLAVGEKFNLPLFRC